METLAEEKYTYKKPSSMINVMKYGTPTAYSGVVSNFSTSNYYMGYLHKLYPAGSINSFDIQVKFTTPTSWTGNGRIINWMGSVDSKTGPYIQAHTSNTTLDFCDGSNYFRTRAVYNTGNNSTYWTRWIWNGTTCSGYYKSTKDGDWILTETITIARAKIIFNQLDFSIGLRASDKASATIWNGNIDLKECYIKINDELAWTGTTLIECPEEESICSYKETIYKAEVTTNATSGNKEYKMIL